MARVEDLVKVFSLGQQEQTETEISGNATRWFNDVHRTVNLKV